MYHRFAAKAGIKLMTFDNEIELQKVKELFPSAELVLRILVDDSAARCSVSQMKYCNNSCEIIIEKENVAC